LELGQQKGACGPSETSRRPSLLAALRGLVQWCGRSATGLGITYRARWILALVLLAAPMAAGAPATGDLTVDALKARLASASIGDKPHLCVQIAQKQLIEADRLYASADLEKGQTVLVDVWAYAELARDYAIQSHKYQKQTEIAVRQMTRRLTEIMHALGHDDQPPVQEAISRLQRVRDDLLSSMFPKGAK